MGQNSKIEWTDHTVNLWWGCSKVHAGCDNCYAEALSHRFGNDVWGPKKGRNRIKSAFSTLDKLQLNAEGTNTRDRVFIGSMMDIFEKPMKLNNPVEFFEDTGFLRDELFVRISSGRYNDLIFLMLTKRPSNIIKYIPDDWLQDGCPENVMIGTSPVDQKTFDNMVPMLQAVNCKRFLSIEPQLDKINILNIQGVPETIDWIICGGESGPQRRPWHPSWGREIMYACEQTGIPFFMKQWDKVRSLPGDLMVREIPELFKT